MKISNEFKIGILATVAIALLILGFNFLKGKNLFESSTRIHAEFVKVDGLALSNPVMVNGLQIGTVYKMQAKERTVSSVVVTITLNKNIDIPSNSVGSISQSLLGTSSLNIQLGDSKTYLKDGDTLMTQQKSGMLDEVKSSLNPALNSVNNTLQSLDSLLEVVGAYFDPATKNNFHTIVENLAASSSSMQRLLNDKTGALAQSLNNVNQITGNLANNNEKINNTIGNLEQATSKLANLKLEETMESIEGTMGELKNITVKANSNAGSLGLLLNDPSLYKNLQSTTRSLNILLDDLRVHPKRYINVSVFGKKDKSTPLTAPLSETPTN